MNRCLRWCAVATAAVTLAAGMARAQQTENPDGSFTLDVTGDVEAQLIFSKAAFRNYFLVVQPSTQPATCSAGVSTLSQCFFDTGPCTTCPGSTPSDVTCACVLNDTRFVGNFAAGTVFQAQLQVDEGRDGTIDRLWYWDKSMNADNFDHLHTFQMYDGTWILQWEDAAGGGDQDFNDLVVMLRVRPPSVPPAAVSLTTLSTGAARTPPPPLKYLTNVVVEDAGVPVRKIRLTVLLLNPTSLPQTVAACTMLNFTSGITETLQGYSFLPGDGTPDCTFTLSDHPSVRYSREQQVAPSCPHPAPVIGDQVTVPAAAGSVPGETAVEYEIRVSDLDTFITNPANKLGSLSADQIRLRINDPAGEGLYTDFLYNLHVAKILCPSNPLTYFDGDPDVTVADGTYTWNHPTSVLVSSPVTIVLPTVNAFLMNPSAAPIWSTLEFLWTDNLAVHLKGHIQSSQAPGTPFAAGGSGIRRVPVILNFPDDLPEGFQGKLEAILRDVATRHVLVTTTEVFAKDTSPPSVSQAHTERTQSALAVRVTVSDPPTGIGQVRLDHMINGNSGRPEYLHWESGDFHGPTGLSASIDTLQAPDIVAADLTAQDGNFHTIPTLRLPVANTGGDHSVECSSAQGATVQLDGSRSTGPADVSVNFLWTGPFGVASGVSSLVQLPLGPSPVTLTLTDGRGFIGSETSTITIIDTTPPVMTSISASPNVLWPPNHAMASVIVAVSAVDACDPEAGSNCKIVSVSSNEPVQGPGQTDSSPDWRITGDLSADLRAERSGKGRGRVYTIRIQCTDASDNTSTDTVQVAVPHDQRK